MSYIPGGGVKKPLNLLEGPIFPDIKKTLPPFKWSGKFWQADPGRTLLATQDLPDTYTYAILAQSRDYNSQTAYGKSSWRQPINETFRLPLITQEDILPLSRLPRPITVPRINPGTADDSNTGGYAAQNNYPSEIVHYLTDRVKPMESRATFFAPTDLPLDNSVLPDLQVKLPPTSASAGFTFAPGPMIADPNIGLGPERITPRLATQMQHPSVENGGLTRVSCGNENLQLDSKTPNVSASSGFEYGTPTGIEAFEYTLDDKTPTHSVSSGYQTHVREGVTPISYDFGYNRPQVSASSGQVISATSGLTPVEYLLEDKMPQVSASAGMNTPFTRDGETRIDFLMDTKLSGGQSVLHATPSLQADNSAMQPSTMKIQTPRARYAYIASRNTRYEAPNYQTGQPKVQTKASALGQYHGYTQTPMIPRTGIDQPRQSLKDW